ncbi:MAG: hypothetical protein KKG25_14420 [Bacteroidetes bacterium]|nr:hypothetical protein [Bacteroidota bacterium]MBU1486040.1 hypothetical protein [Bacteroidota bacterium]MBU2374321.1 hypothetical protein [Bacteroidota bacterium]
MSENKRHRIKFYSKEDMAGRHQLSKAEGLLTNFNAGSDFGLIDLIEFYNIKLYFDNNLFLTNWDESQKASYKENVEVAYTRLKERILKISDETLELELTTLDYNYYEDYWSLLNNLNSLKKVSDSALSAVLEKLPRQIRYILKEKKVVDKYDKTIKGFLITYSDSAEILLSSIEEKDNFGRKEKNHFPKSLSITEKETIINSYLDSADPNLNYVRLIENSRDTNEFKLSPKTRLKAKKKSQELNDKVLQNGYTWNAGVGVSLSKDQKEPFKFKTEGTTFEASYSESFLDLLPSDLDLFLVFKYIFFYTDDKNLIALVSRQSELDVFERTFMKSKNEYEIGFSFFRKENLSNLQLYIYKDYLKRKGKSLESIIHSFIGFLNERISPNKIVFRLPSNELSYLEKIRTLTPDFEFLLKQYKLLVDEKSIDLELIQISSAPIRISEIYSNKPKKYIYSDDNLILQLKYLFFSDQSHLYYVKHFENKYHSLFDLITNENVKFEYFENYQRETIQSLINDGYLKLSNEGYVTLNKDILIYLIGELHHKEVLSYWSYPLPCRAVIEELIEQKLVIAENTLLSRQERNYFNFYLNKKEFTNGYDLRNKYLHGTNTFYEKEHEFDYHRLLKIIILTLLKLHDDITTE